MAFHRESYGGKRILSFCRVMANEYTLYQQATPFGDKRQFVWIIQSFKGVRNVSDKFCLCGITMAMLAGT